MDGPLEDAFVRGEPVPLEKMREMARLARKMSPAASEVADGILDAGGLSTVRPIPDGFWARITGQASISQPLYSFQEIVNTVEGDGWQDSPDGYVSTNNNALESSGNTDVPLGSRVWITPQDASEGWRFSWTAGVQFLQVNAGVPDGSGHYDASVLSVDPATGLATVHESCWFVAPGTTRLPTGSTFLGCFTGTYSSRNVYVNHGPLITELDSGTHRIPTTFLDLHDPTFLAPDELTAGSGHARVRLNWGTAIQPVGTANFPGIQERAARVDHVHALATRTTFDPPPGAVSNTVLFNETNNTLWFFVGGFIGWVPICPCPGWGPSGSLQGSLQGSAGTPGEVITPCCEGVAIPDRLFIILRPGSLPGCECVAPFIIFPIDHDAESDTWSGGDTICGVAVSAVFYCYSNPSWALEIHGPGGVATNTDFPASCSPDFEWPLDTAFEWDLAGTGICLGSMTVGVSS